MSSALGIALANLCQGVTASAVLNGLPTGTLTFWAARTPNTADAVQISQTGTGPFTLTLPHPACWYVWPQDNNGFGDFDAVWVGYSNKREVDEAGMALQQILCSHEKGIQAALRQYNPNARFTGKQILYGSATGGLEFPLITIQEAKFPDQYVGAPFISELTVSFIIACCIEHAEEQTELPMANGFTRSIQLLINQPSHEVIDLPCGITMNNCRAVQGSAGEFPLEDIGWVSAGTLAWSGRTILQESGSYGVSR